MAFGKEIKRIKLGQKLTAARVAEILGVSQDRLTKWMQKDLNPREEDIIKMERKMGMSVDEIMKLDKLPIIQKVPNNSTIHINMPVSEFTGERVELTAAMRAAIKVLTLKNIEQEVRISELEAKLFKDKTLKQSFSAVSLELEKMTEDEIKHILDEWRKKSVAP
jgi:transcriptional regulator with XRE-family HTH domain